MSSRFVWMIAGVVAIAIGAPARAQAQAFVPVSVATDGTFGNGASGGGVFSANGRLVAPASSATNLVAGEQPVGDSGLRGISPSRCPRTAA